jgi:GNAT superfamily N-acetyltransferase
MSTSGPDRAVELRTDFRTEPRSYDDPDVTRMVAEVQAEYVERYGTQDQAAVEHDEFLAPNGLFLVGLLDGEPVATGGWRRLPDMGEGFVEIKRMYVMATARKRGLARRMLAELEESARRAGATRVVLNTGIMQPEAIALYESSGYEVIPGFGHYACYPDARFYGKSLG